MVQLARLQDFKQGWNSQVGPECGKKGLYAPAGRNDIMYQVQVSVPSMGWKVTGRKYQVACNRLQVFHCKYQKAMIISISLQPNYQVESDRMQSNRYRAYQKKCATLFSLYLSSYKSYRNCFHMGRDKRFYCLFWVQNGLWAIHGCRDISQMFWCINFLKCWS